MAKTILVMSHGKSLKVPASERDYFASLGYEVPDKDEDDEGEAAFDPAEHNIEEVNAYLATADEAEKARVRALEAKRKGGARKGIIAEGDDLL